MAKDEKMKLSEALAALEKAFPEAGPDKLMRAAACMMADDDGDDDDDGGDDDDGDESMDVADGDPYGSESEEQMNARQADEMSNCASDEDRAACASKHAAEKDRFAKRNTGLEVHNRSEKSGMSASRRGGSRAARGGDMKKAELEKEIATHPMVVAMANELTEMRQAQNKAAATEKVDAAIRDGRLIPSQREWAINYCAADFAGFEKFMGAQPKIIRSGSDNTFTARIGEPKDEILTQREMSIVQNLGLVSTFGGQDKAIEKFTSAKKERLSRNAILD